MRYWRGAIQRAFQKSMIDLGLVSFKAAMLRFLILILVVAGLFYLDRKDAAADEISVYLILAGITILLAPVLFVWHLFCDPVDQISKLSEEKLSVEEKLKKSNLKKPLLKAQVTDASWSGNPPTPNIVLFVSIKNLGRMPSVFELVKCEVSYKGNLSKNFGIIHADEIRITHENRHEMHLKKKDALYNVGLSPVPSGGQSYGYINISPRDAEACRLIAKTARVRITLKDVHGRTFTASYVLKQGGNEERPVMGLETK